MKINKENKDIIAKRLMYLKQHNYKEYIKLLEKCMYKEMI